MVSSTATTGRPNTSGPSIRRCRPCAFSDFRTMKASNRSPAAAAACNMAPATGSAPRVNPPTASNSQSATRSRITRPMIGAAAVQGDAAQVHVVVGLDAGRQGDLAVHHRQLLDQFDQCCGVVGDGQLGHACTLVANLLSRGLARDCSGQGRTRVHAMASPWKAARVRSATATIFAEMSALALATDSINLGQGFPTPTDRRSCSTRHGPPSPRASTSTRPARAWRRCAPPSLRIPNGATAHDPDTEVLVTTGATEALAAAILAFVDPGDEVIALEPFYDSYAATIELAGGVRVGVGLFGPDFRLDLDEFAAAFTPRTKAILINSPHNPTGVVLSLDEVAEIARLAVENDVLVICDEVYEHLLFDAPSTGRWPLFRTCGSVRSGSPRRAKRSRRPAGRSAGRSALLNSSQRSRRSSSS